MSRVLREGSALNTRVGAASRPHKRLMATVTAGILGALGALGSTVASPTTAHAWTDGNHYAMGYVFDHNIVTYYIDPITIPGWDNANIKNAAYAWTAVQSNLFYVEGGSSRTTTDVQIYGYTIDDNQSGWGGCNTTTTICPSRVGAGYVKIYFDGNATIPANGHGSYTNSPTWDQDVAGHEQGHSFGLDHSCVVGSLMQGPNTTYNCGYYVASCTEPNCVDTPQADDRAGDIALYGRYNPPPPPPCRSVLCRINQPAPPNKLAVLQQLLAYLPTQIPLNTSAGMGW